MHNAIATKDRLLEDAGYLYSLDRNIYFSRETGKVFSAQFVEDHSEAELEASLAEPSGTPGQWHFYFNSPPSESVKRILSEALASA